jgi:hypothetical protein
MKCLHISIAAAMVGAGIASPGWAQVTRAPGGGKGAATGAQGQANAGQTMFYNGFSSNPWFSNMALRQQLNLNNNQFNQLNQAYSKAWNGYQNSLRNMGNLPPDQFNNQTQQYWNAFNNAMTQAAQNTLTAQQYQRFRQLYYQYQGYGAFSNPAVQQELRLTAPQQQQFNKYAQDFNQNLNGMFNNNAGTQELNNAYMNLRNQMNGNINSTLTPQQQRQWQQMLGAPHNFTAPSQPGRSPGGKSGGADI